MFGKRSRRNKLEGSDKAKKVLTEKQIKRKLYLALGSLFLVPFIASFNASVISSALPAITVALDAPSSKTFWCGTGFFIARACMTPIFGAFSEAFGRRLSLLSALTIFIIAAAICSAAQNIDMLIAGRVLQGFAAGGLNAIVNVILTDMIELRNRGKVTGLFSMSQILGLPGGLILGGAITETTSWRWVFIITIPICSVGLLGLIFFLDLEPPEQSFMVALKAFDWIGSTVLTAAIVSFMYGLTTGGTQNPWNSASVIAPMVLGIVGIAGFVFFESRIKNPMIPPRIFCNRTAAAGFISSALFGIVFWCSSSYLNLYFLTSLGHSLLISSLDSTPGLAILVVSSACSGFLFAKLKKFQKIMWGAWALVIVGCGLLSTLRPDSNAGEQYGYQILAASAGGVILPGRLLSVQASQQDRDVAIATTAVAFFLNAGQSFGFAIGGTVIQNRWASLVASTASVHPDYVIPSSELETAWKIMQSYPPDQQKTYENIMADCIDTMYIVCVCFGGVAFLTSFLSKDLSLNKDGRGKQRLKNQQKDVLADEEEAPRMHSQVALTANAASPAEYGEYDEPYSPEPVSEYPPHIEWSLPRDTIVVPRNTAVMPALRRENVGLPERRDLGGSRRGGPRAAKTWSRAIDPGARPQSWRETEEAISMPAIRRSNVTQKDRQSKMWSMADQAAFVLE